MSTNIPLVDRNVTQSTLPPAAIPARHATLDQHTKCVESTQQAYLTFLSCMLSCTRHALLTCQPVMNLRCKVSMGPHFLQRTKSLSVTLVSLLAISCDPPQFNSKQSTQPPVAPPSQALQEAEQESTISTHSTVKPSAHTDLPRGLATRLDKSPQEVLAGTDFEPLTNFHIGTTKLVAGDYDSDNGGSGTRITLQFHKDVLSVTRALIEPGARPQLKVYENVPLHDDQIWAGTNDLAVVATKDGIIVLEPQSKNEPTIEPHWLFCASRPQVAPILP